MIGISSPSNGSLVGVGTTAGCVSGCCAVVAQATAKTKTATQAESALNFILYVSLLALLFFGYNKAFLSQRVEQEPESVSIAISDLEFPCGFRYQGNFAIPDHNVGRPSHLLV